MRKSRLLLITFMIAMLLTGCHEHTFRPATCYEPTTCTKCGKTEGTPLGHNYGEATCTEPGQCTRCGSTIGTAKGHSFTEATCEVPKTCTVCGETEGTALEHDYVDATCTEPKTCKNCKATFGEPAGHKYSEGSCTEDRKCKVCGEVQKAAGHDFMKATCTEPKTCTVCGETEGEALGHNMVDGKCSVCGLEVGTLNAMKSIVGLTAGCETDAKECVVNTAVDPSEGNPYDVEYRYGSAYESYVEMCDWSLIYDASYYKKTYPLLARLYQYNDELLLRHFQTVGVHEGRQANESYNPMAYYYNCANKVYNAFDKDYACYAIYYMLHYDEEKSVNTKTANNGKPVRKQVKTILTCVQKEELKWVNKYRVEVGAEECNIDAELCAYANFRAWINAHDGWKAHDWAKQNNDKVWNDWMFKIDASKVAENTVTKYSWQSRGTACYEKYRTSPEHYEAMIRDVYKYMGTSHMYNSKTVKLDNGKWSGDQNSFTFDCFVDHVNTAVNP